MIDPTPVRVLFTGYAPVHFVCFRPLYERLVKKSNIHVFLSGGLRTTSEERTVYDEPALYAPFGVDPRAVIPTEALQELSFDVLFAANTNMIAPRECGKVVQIFHGISFRNKAVRPENMDADHYFLVGPYMRRRFVDAQLMTADDPRALQIGFPKTDRLINGELDRAALLERFGLDGSRPIVLYAPTGQKYNSLETMGESVIERLAASDRYDLIVKPHDHPKNREIDWFSRLGRFEGPHALVSRELDVIPLLFLADLLLTDASSVSSEYSLLDRPMVFLDVPRLLKRANRSAGSQLDLDSWGRHAGEVVETPDQVVAAIDDALLHPERHAALRRAMAADLFYNPGRSTDRAMEWFAGMFPQSDRGQEDQEQAGVSPEEVNASRAAASI